MNITTRATSNDKNTCYFAKNQTKISKSKFNTNTNNMVLKNRQILILQLSNFYTVKSSFNIHNIHTTYTIL